MIRMATSPLATLAHARTTEVVYSALSIAIEKIASEMAKEILNDPAWRAEIKRLTAASFGATVGGLQRARFKRTPKARRTARRR